MTNSPEITKAKYPFHFDIRNLPFSRKDSLLSLIYEDNTLYLSRFTKDYPVIKHAAKEFHAKAFSLWLNNREISIDALEAGCDQLKILGGKGNVAATFDGKDSIRLHGFRQCLLIEPYGDETDTEVIALPDDTVLLSSRLEGEFLFVPLKGTLKLENRAITVFPSDDGCFEISICFDLCEPERPEKFRPFEACRIENLNDYETWYEQYPLTSPVYESLKRVSAYAVWICCCILPNAPVGYIPLYCKFDSAFCWQGVYHALGVMNNPDTVVYMLLSMFQYQDRYGQLPDLVDDRNINFLSTKPPVQGFILVSLMERLGNRITKQHCEKMYEPFKRWYDWWMNERDTDRDGIPQYNQGCECSVDNSKMFSKGVPVECPDLIAYMIMMAEALERMSCRMKKADNEQYWHSEKERLLNALIRDFWDGRHFAARLSGSHEVVETDEIDVCTPVILGKRLPEDILKTLIGDLKDPELFWTPIGLRHAPAFSGDFMRGVIGGFWQIKFAIGLHDAGETQMAVDILEKYCELNMRLGPSLGYHEKDADFKPGQEKKGMRLGMYSALACGIYLASIGLIEEWKKQI